MKFNLVIAIIIAIALFIGLVFIFAFREPSSSPPNDDDRLIKIQTGELIIDKPTLFKNSYLIIESGKLGFNTSSPTALFHLKSISSSTIPFQIESINPSYFDPNLFPNWTYRRSITIDNTQNTSTLTNYQILVTLDTGQLIQKNKLRSDCGDLRFTDSDGSTQLNYWLVQGCNTQTTQIFVKVPSIPSSSLKTIYLYYGNNNATSQSNTSTVFIAELDGLIGAWNFNDGSGTVAYDTSGNNNHGTLLNGPIWGQGIIGKALSFDGSDDYVSIPAKIFTYPMSIVLWSKSDDVADRHFVYSSQGTGDGWGPENETHVSQSSSGKFSFFSKTNNIEHIRRDVSGFNTTSWHFLAINLSSTYEFYVDNNLVDSLTISGTPNFSNYGNFTYFGKPSSNTKYMRGILDEIYIFNRVLSSQEISLLYNNAGYSTPNYPGKVLIRKITFPEPTIIVNTTEQQSNSIFAFSLYLSTSSNLGLLTNNPLSTLSVNGNVAIGTYAYTTSAPENSLIISGKLGVGINNPLASLEVANRNDVILAGGRYGLNIESLTSNKTLNPRTDPIYQYLNPGSANRVIYLTTTTAQIGDRFIIKNTAPYNSSRRLQINVGSSAIDYIYALTTREYLFDGSGWQGANAWSKTINETNIALGLGARAYSGGVAIGGSAYAYPGVAIGGYAWCEWTYGVCISGGYAVAYTYGVAVGGANPRGHYYGTGIGYNAKGNGYSVAIGFRTANNVTYSSQGYNLLLGAYAGYQLTTGVGNIILGYQSGYDTSASPTTGSYNILIGYQAGTPANNTSNFLNIGNLIFATGINTATGSNISNGNVGIGTISPTALLHLKGQTGYNQLRLETSYTPSGTDDTNGNIGDITWDNNYLYIKTGAGWKRATGTPF